MPATWRCGGHVVEAPLLHHLCLVVAAGHSPEPAACFTALPPACRDTRRPRCDAGTPLPSGTDLRAEPPAEERPPPTRSATISAAGLCLPDPCPPSRPWSPVGRSKTLCGFDVAEISCGRSPAEANTAAGSVRQRKNSPDRPSPGGLTRCHWRPTGGRPRGGAYLLFNEGYSSTRATAWCAGAVRGGGPPGPDPRRAPPRPPGRRRRPSLAPAVPRLTAGRAVGRSRDLLLLDDQDRASWDRRLIAEAFRWFARSAAGERRRATTRRRGSSRSTAAPAASPTRTGTGSSARTICSSGLAPSPVHEVDPRHRGRGAGRRRGGLAGGAGDPPRRPRRALPPLERHGRGSWPAAADIGTKRGPTSARRSAWPAPTPSARSSTAVSPCWSEKAPSSIVTRTGGRRAT